MQGRVTGPATRWGQREQVGGKSAVGLLQSRRNRWEGGLVDAALVELRRGAPRRPERKSAAVKPCKTSRARPSPPWRGSFPDGAWTAAEIVVRARPLSERLRPMAGSLSAPSTRREEQATCRDSSARVQDGLSPPLLRRVRVGPGLAAVGGAGGACGSRAGGGAARCPTCVRRGWGWRVSGKGNAGGPGGYKGWVHAGWVRKIIHFWQKWPLNCVFWYFIVLPPYPLPKSYDEWVRREG
jgi:hypothetical protein